MGRSRATTTSVRLVISSDLKLVDLAHAAAERMAEVVGFDAEEALNVGLAVREAVINAIVHGNRSDRTLAVRVGMAAEARRLRITVRDRGQGFDPDAEPDPREAPNLLNTTGRGLLLMRAFVDQVKFRHLRERGMEVTLLKSLADATDENPQADGQPANSRLETQSDPRRSRA